MSCVKTHSEGLKAQASTRQNRFIVKYEFHLMSITSDNNVVYQLIQKNSKHWFWAIKTLFPDDAQELPESQHYSFWKPRWSLQTIFWSSFPTLLWKSASWISVMSHSCHDGWANRDVREAGREGGALAPSWLTGYVCGRQVHDQLFLLFLDLCVCLKIYWLCDINRNAKTGLETPRNAEAQTLSMYLYFTFKNSPPRICFYVAWNKIPSPNTFTDFNYFSSCSCGCLSFQHPSLWWKGPLNPAPFPHSSCMVGSWLAALALKCTGGSKFHRPCCTGKVAAAYLETKHNTLWTSPPPSLQTLIYELATSRQQNDTDYERWYASVYLGLSWTQFHIPAQLKHVHVHT